MREISVWHEVKHPNVLPLCGLFWGIGDMPAMVAAWCEHGDIITFLARAKVDLNDSDQGDSVLDGLKLELVRKYALVT